MVNEEDHLRIQVLHSGLALESCWEEINQIDDLLEEQVSFAFNEQLGYLTACPTNCGTGIRTSVMLHLPALVALTCPSYNSYERLKPHSWAGSTVSWGLDNREASVRVASVFRGREAESTNVELKACDPSCNPYLALGGLMVAGLDGVRRRLEPPEPVYHDPANLSATEQARHGIRPLPASLREALSTLQADPVLFPALGDLLGRCIIAVRTSEADALERLSPDEARLAHLRVF